MVTYGTTAIPSDQITVLSGSTVAVSAAFENSVGLIGGMDTANGTATTGEVTQVRSTSDAADKFGEGSELHEQVSLAFQNGAATIYALPVAETQTTETFTGTSSGTVSDVPVMDPNIHDEHDVTAQDTVEATSVEVNIVYDSAPSQPTDANTMNFNPVTGEWAADESSDYDITYTHGDYSTTAIDPLLDESPRIVIALTETEAVVNDVATELNSRATNFDFMHAVAGAIPKVTDTANYTDGVEERRVSLTYPSRGYIDDAETDMQRTAGAVGGYLAGLPLGPSATNDEVGGFTALYEPLTGPSDAGDLIDAEVLPLLDYPPVTIVKDMTTSTDTQFERVYGMQIVDEATELSHLISREFVGRQNSEGNRAALERSHINTYLDMENGTPKLLDDFNVEVTENDANPDQVDVTIGLDVVDIMDTIDVTITVGNVIRNGGAE